MKTKSCTNCFSLGQCLDKTCGKENDYKNHTEKVETNSCDSYENKPKEFPKFASPYDLYVSIDETSPSIDQIFQTKEDALIANIENNKSLKEMEQKYFKGSVWKDKYIVVTLADGIDYIKEQAINDSKNSYIHPTYYEL